MAKKDFMTLMKEKTVDVRPSLLSAEENIKNQIVVLEQLRDLIPPLTADELNQLEQNVLKHGVKDPLTIWETTADVAGTGSESTPVYVLIDGHNREQIIRKHQLDFRINLVRFASLDETKDYMIAYQLGRRNLTPEQASYLRGLRYNQQKTQRGSNLQSGVAQVNVAEILASEYGVSSRTIKRDGEFAASLEQTDSDTKRKVLAGKLPKSVIQSKNHPELKLSNHSGGGLTSTNSIGLSIKSAKRATDLKTQIQKLANGDLGLQACSELIKSTNELLALLSTK
ncbi:ParB N-terminal domain-containing protein [Spirosoma pomorum]